MKIIKIDSQKNWEEVVDKFNEVSFLQSWNWGQFQQQLGSMVTRLVIEDNQNFLASQYYFKKSRFFSFLYCPRGPITTHPHLLALFIDALIKEAEDLKVDFLLIEPEGQSELVDKLKLRNFLYLPSTQPEHTARLSLFDKDVNTLFSNMRKTTRQMVRKAIVSNIVIRSYTDLSHWDEFVTLFTETIHRQKFNPHSVFYMKQQFQIFSKDNRVKLYLAQINNQSVAGAIIISYQKTSVYLHAASIAQGRKLGAAQLLVQTAILDAKQKGDRFFDFWGIAPNDNPNHPWAGITTFKMGFGGETISYPGGFVLPIKIKKYQLYLLINRLRKTPVFKTIQRILLSMITRG